MSGNAASATYRWVAVLMTVVAVLGWGVFFVMSTSAGSVQDAQRHEIVRLRQERDRLDVALEQQRTSAAEIAELQARLATMRDDLARTKEAHETAKNALAAQQAALAATRTELSSKQTQIGAAQTELAAFEERLVQAREKVAEQTATVRPRKGKRTGKASFRKRKRSG
jgi:chromosome segregation ATPase